MKTWEKIVIGVLISILFLFFSLVNFVNSSYRPHWLKTWLGTGRTLSPPMKVSLRVDGVEIPQAKCFVMNELFNGTPVNSLILLLPPRSNSSYHDIFIVSRKHKMVGRPVSHSKNDYDLLDEQTLFQSETGSIMVDFAGPKFDDYNPQLEIKDNYIKFIAPQSFSSSGRKIEVFLH